MDSGVVCWVHSNPSAYNLLLTLFLHADFPLEAQNLHYTLRATTTDGVTIELYWDLPLNDGGVAITSYLIFVNMSQQVVSTDTTTTLTLNSTGEHIIDISAVNECGLIGANASITTIAGGSLLPLRNCYNLCPDFDPVLMNATFECSTPTTITTCALATNSTGNYVLT